MIGFLFISCSVRTDGCSILNPESLVFDYECSSVINLTGCSPGQCYFISDLSYPKNPSSTKFPVSSDSGPTRLSLFQSVTVSGADSSNWTSKGIWFKPKLDTDVLITIKVKTRDEVLLVHPNANSTSYSHPLSQVSYGFPLCSNS